MPYRLLRPLLFRLDAERAHDLTLTALASHGAATAAALLTRAVPRRPRVVMGIEFPNPVGLAAGLDKDGSAICGLAALGFGSLEIGTVTPRPQPGNPRPRLFRLPDAQALINRYGFNNRGVAALVNNVMKARAAGYRGVLGINIGKNKDTPNERASDDYLICLEQVYAHADYVTVNISSPNTPGLRDLQYGEALDRLLDELKEAQQRLADRHGRYVPLALKIAPDVADADLPVIAAALVRARLDAVIATNTTFARDGVESLAHAGETGGLSGAPLAVRSTAVIAGLARALDGALPVIGVGGILSGDDARAKIEAGASLVQIYTGLIYRGPALVREAVEAIG